MPAPRDESWHRRGAALDIAGPGPEFWRFGVGPHRLVRASRFGSDSSGAVDNGSVGNQPGKLQMFGAKQSRVGE